MVDFQKKSKQFEGVYSSILYFCYTFCARHNFNILADKRLVFTRILPHFYSLYFYRVIFIFSKTRIASVLKKILFSVPGFVAVRYIVDLLNSSARFGLSDYLCHRSGTVI